MAEVAHRFDDSTAYERFMGNWSRAAGAVFLDWIAALLVLAGSMLAVAQEASLAWYWTDALRQLLQA